MCGPRARLPNDDDWTLDLNVLNLRMTRQKISQEKSVLQKSDKLRVHTDMPHPRQMRLGVQTAHKHTQRFNKLRRTKVGE